MALSVPSAAQDYPARPVKIIVPYPPGGVIDIMARQLSVPLSETLGQPVLVENRSGAAGLIGHDAVAKAAPDGYTIVIAAAGPIAASVKLYKTMPYDASRDFAPIGMVADVEVVFVASAAMRKDTLADVIKYGKENPGKLRFGINSVGSMHHLLAEQFLSLTSINATRVPYKGAGQAVVDLVAGHIDVEMESLPVVTEYVKAGQLKVLAVASNNRLRTLPDSPTFGEQGLEALVAAPWYALLAPAGTPAQIVSRLNSELNKALSLPRIEESFANMGVRPVKASSGETSKFIKSETERWGKIVQEAAIKMD
jgi:tripartite-type tricarboxylate transporter receptor subunit TctC